MTDLDPEQLTSLPAADAAFIASDSLTFLGEKLHPFSVRRQIAAQAIGNRLLSGRVTGDQAGLYDGMLSDVAGVLYLCSRPESESHLAVRRPDQVMDKALAWAESIGLAVGGDVYTEAVEIYGRIFEALQSAQFRIKEQKSGNG